MDLLTRMDLALAYVENNLTGEIDQEVLARIACCSIYNFSRMFSFITDISLSFKKVWLDITLIALIAMAL